MPRLWFDAHDVTIRATPGGAKFIITAESDTQLTAFALRPEALRSFAAKAARAVRERDAGERQRRQAAPGQAAPGQELATGQ